MIKGYKSQLMDMYEKIRQKEKSNLANRQKELKEKLPQVFEYEREINKLSLKLSMLALRKHEKESNRNCRRNHTPCGRRRLRGRGALLCIPLFPENRDQRTELRRADRRAGQRGNSEAHCGLYTQHYRARWKNRDIKRHGDRPHVCGRPRGGKTAGVPEYSCMACILLERERKPGGGGLCL